MKRPTRIQARGISRAVAWREASPVALVSFLILALVVTAMILAGCGVSAETADEMAAASQAEPAPENRAEAIFAGGCFWCMEPPFDKIDGVYATISGYTGGEKVDPTYKEVSAGITGHAEAVQVVYDSSKVTYEELLEVFWHNIDPTVENRQFCDWGTQYRTGIFYLNDEQKALAEASKKEIVDSGRFERVATEITEAGPFYPAEDYHQDFYKKSPVRYKSYRLGCGRDARLEELWGDAS